MSEATTTNNRKPGVHPGLDYAQYHALEIDGQRAVSASVLHRMNRSPAHARHYQVNPPTSTKAMLVGSVTHAAILEPDVIERDYFRAPKCDRRTKIGKNTWAEAMEAAEGRDLISIPDYDRAMTMRDAVWAHPLASAILGAPGHCEVSMLWWMHDVLCRSRPDAVKSWEGTALVSLKTTRDAQTQRFMADFARLGYHVYESFALDGLNALFPTGHDRRAVTIAVESDAPHGVRVFELSGVAMEQGRNDWEHALVAYRKCVEANHWPGYPEVLEAIDLPRWALTPDRWEVIDELNR